MLTRGRARSSSFLLPCPPGSASKAACAPRFCLISLLMRLVLCMRLVLIRMPWRVGPRVQRSQFSSVFVIQMPILLTFSFFFCCPGAQGHGRSAVTAAAVLMGMGGASTVDEAMAKVVLARPGVKPNFRQIDLLREWAAASGFKPSAGTSASGSGAAAAAGMAASGPSAPEGARATQREEEEEEEESSTTTGLEATTAKGDEQALGTAGGQEVRFKEE